MSAFWIAVAVAVAVAVAIVAVVVSMQTTAIYFFRIANKANKRMRICGGRSKYNDHKN